MNMNKVVMKVMQLMLTGVDAVTLWYLEKLPVTGYADTKDPRMLLTPVDHIQTR